MNKKILSLLLTLALMAAVLSGCAGSAAPEESAPPAESEAPASEAPASEAPAFEVPAPEETPAPVEETPEPVPESSLLALPLEETATVTIWDVFPPPLAGFMDGPWDCSVNPVLEEACNVKFEYTMASTETASEMFNLMVVSGDYCDLIYGINTYYTAGADMAVIDNVVIDHREMAETLPNFVKLRNEFPDSVELTTEGFLAYFPVIVTQPFNDRIQGMSTRGDWLDELGAELPQTYDELYVLMTAYHTQFGATGGYLLANDGFSTDLASGFGISNGFYQVDGTVKYGPLEDGFRDYAEYVHKLYSESLIPKDFYTMQGAPTAYITSTDVTVWSCDVGMWSFFTKGITTEDYYTIGFSQPVLNKGDKTHFSSGVASASTEGLSISTDCEQLDVMAAIINYMYSDEFAIPANFGIEGEGLSYDENGDPHLTDLVLHNPDTITSFAVKKYTLFTYFPTQSMETRYMDGYTQEQLDTIDLWTNFGDDAYVYPSEIELSAEDSEAAAIITTDVATLVDEYLLGFITGTISIDAFDEFKQNILNLKIQEVIDLYQEYYDAYLEQNA